VQAVVGRHASLLPAGITAVDGRFAAGDPVDLVDVRGVPIARGLVNYDAAELPTLLGRSTGELAAPWARRTNARSSTATTWCCSDQRAGNASRRGSRT